MPKASKKLKQGGISCRDLVRRSPRPPCLGLRERRLLRERLRRSSSAENNSAIENRRTPSFTGPMLLTCYAIVRHAKYTLRRFATAVIYQRSDKHSAMKTRDSKQAVNTFHVLPHVTSSALPHSAELERAIPNRDPQSNPQ